MKLYKNGVIRVSTSVVNVGDKSIKVVSNEDLAADNGEISVHDKEMDKRAVAAVHSAIDRAKVCNKPIAKYDMKKKRAFIEYADGSIEYVS